jgi:hypothetical protein
MSDEDVFLKVGFDKEFEPAFRRICAFIRSIDGCNADVYKPPTLKEARAAHNPPAKSGKKKAQQVFLIIHRRKGAMLLRRRLRYRLGKPKDQQEIRVDSGFTDWAQLERTVREWSHDPKQSPKPKPERDFGDGVALPGGLPETNRSRF